MLVASGCASWTQWTCLRSCLAGRRALVVLARACSTTASPKPLRARKRSKAWDAGMGLYGTEKKAFVDWMEITVHAGNGGNGRVSELSLFANEFAGPDGGDGGHGGHILFTANEQYTSLCHLRSFIKGNNGTSGGVDECEGKNAKHTIIKVPVGTVVRNMEKEILAELSEPDVQFLAARGGAGGKGNAYFKSSTNKLPSQAEMGGLGEKFTFELELKTMADIGLIGFPNAGKSTFLRAISRARPKVASYPFTTLTPHIGIVKYDDYEQLAVADIPGIIEGAHQDEGLGIDFLRHIERCSCLLYVIDISESNSNEQFDVLRHELDQYLPGLSTRPSAVLANKIDLLDSSFEVAVSNLASVEAAGLPIFPISGKMGTNLRDVLIFMRRLHDQVREKRAAIGDETAS